MKYKVLLVGNNNATIDDFFIHLLNQFDCITTSRRYFDVYTHLKFFKPDILVYCMQKEAQGNITDIITARNDYAKRLPVVIIGSDKDCNLFNNTYPGLAALVLEKPITVNVISDKLSYYLKRFIKKSPNTNAEEDEDTVINNVLKDSEEAIKNSLRELDELEDLSSAEAPAEKRKHILVVDDDPVMLKVIKKHLEEKYNVGTALNGNLALKFLESKRTDLILLDYEMPGDNGPTVMGKIRSHPLNKNIPIVFLTGVADSAKIQEVLIQKPEGYLLKPVDKEKLLLQIKSLIG
ncbi:MAG: response regulator [Lachnospiraceae bacterium]|nr:response regulator [Lachnospiraceae bacterium]